MKHSIQHVESATFPALSKPREIRFAFVVGQTKLTKDIKESIHDEHLDHLWNWSHRVATGSSYMC